MSIILIWICVGITLFSLLKAAKSMPLCDKWNLETVIWVTIAASMVAIIVNLLFSDTLYTVFTEILKLVIGWSNL